MNFLLDTNILIYYITKPDKLSEFDNGREYYAWHDKNLQNLPEYRADRPAADYLRWHQEEVWLG
jgi:hypothetical protein